MGNLSPTVFLEPDPSKHLLVSVIFSFGWRNFPLRWDVENKKTDSFISVKNNEVLSRCWSCLINKTDCVVCNDCILFSSVRTASLM